MTKFNPEKKLTMTYGECLDPIFKITDKEDAQQYKAEYIVFIQTAINKEPRDYNMTAEEIANVNIGYYAAYGSFEDRQRIENLFNCAHPFFGVAK